MSKVRDFDYRITEREHRQPPGGHLAQQVWDPKLRHQLTRGLRSWARRALAVRP